MRYVPAFCLREGMMLAKSLYGQEGVLLLQQGQQLQQSHIDGIAKHGFQGVYITDRFSEEIQIQAVIDDELRDSAARAIRDIYVQSVTEGVSQKTMDDAKVLVRDIIDEIVNNRNIMVNMIDLKSYDNYTYYHSVNVGVLSLVLGVALGMSGADLYRLGLGALLHDIGKVFIPRDIIGKTDPLTPEEFDEVKKHPETGYTYLMNANLDFPPSALLCILQHHERCDGSGYPQGLVGDEISLLSRIVSIADVFDAMTSDRPYRAAVMPSEVMEFLMGGAGTLFDPELVRLFTRKVAAFPLGTCVTLSNGRTGIVVENYEDCCLRPKVKLLSDDPEPVYYDLKNDRDMSTLTITGIAKM